MKITLAVIAGPSTGQSFAFDRPDRFLVGRSIKAHFRLRPEKDKDLRVSRLHFLVEVNPPLCRLHDLGSRNGTHVNGQRVSSCDLTDGDEIRAGQTVLRVCFTDLPTTTEHIPHTGPLDGSPAATLAEPMACRRPMTSAPDGLCVCCATQRPDADEPACADCRRRAEQQPQPISGYLLLRELGKGGMGVVYLALRQLDQQPMAVKTILPTAIAQRGLIDRFLREANILRQLSHPHIVAFHELGDAGGSIFLAMDYVRGTNAAEFVKERGPLPIRVAVRMIRQGLQALDYAHARSFVHRDVKPANVMLEMASQGLHVKLADFGLARIYQASRLSGLTLQNEMGGTLEFMPPEQITNFRDVQPAADQFSAAATLYYLLTRQFIRNLAGSLADKIEQILSRDAVPISQRRPNLPLELAGGIHQALERDPRRRYPTVTHFRQALQPFAS
jgi:serine/threonine-protein kinase